MFSYNLRGFAILEVERDNDQTTDGQVRLVLGMKIFPLYCIDVSTRLEPSWRCLCKSTGVCATIFSNILGRGAF